MIEYEFAEEGEQTMHEISQLSRIRFGQFPTPLYRLDRISRIYGKNI